MSRIKRPLQLVTSSPGCRSVMLLSPVCWKSVLADEQDLDFCMFCVQCSRSLVYICCCFPLFLAFMMVYNIVELILFLVLEMC